MERTANKLDAIIAHKRKEIANFVRPVRDSELERLAAQPRKGRSFFKAITRPGRLSVVAEIKRRSPSAGSIFEGADAVEQARKYYNAEADAISVLTDQKYFGGTLKDLWDVTDLMATRSDPVPCLRKDFMVHPVQVVEAAEAGARCILIIVRALTDDEIRDIYAAANAAKLDTIFEIHEEAELERALDADARIIGVNNRDLGTFVTDLSFSERVIPEIPGDIATIAESGIHTMDDIERMRDTGADAVLIGEALMRCDDVEEFVEAVHGDEGDED